MILTSRTVFFNAALQIYEGFNRAKVSLSKYELNIAQYSNLEKARILYKHLSFSRINPDFKNQFLKEKSYLFVINHRNYTPRLIEYFTNPLNVDSIPLDKYINEFVIKNLDNPSELWKFHYSVHIDDESRMLVDTIFLLGQETNHSLVECGYSQRLKVEFKFRNFIPVHNSFIKSVKTLQDGFIKTRILSNEKDILKYSLYNPSLGDFLISYFNEANNAAHKKLLLFSIVSYQGFKSRFHSSDKNYIIIYEFEYSELLQYFISNIDILKSNNTSYHFSVELDILFHSINLFNFKIIEPFLEPLFKTINIKDIASFQLFELIKLTIYQKNNFFDKFFQTHWNSLINITLRKFSSSYHYSLIHNLFEYYFLNFDDYIKRHNLEKLLIESKHRFISSRIKEYVEDANLISRLDLNDDSSSLLSELESKLKSKIRTLSNEIGLKGYRNYSYYYGIDELKESIDEYLRDQLEMNRDPIDSGNFDTDLGLNSDDSIEDLFSESFVE
ncbi:hypothetical protein LEP1GSC193_0003 [Leptospira alstonii serovar Pingchang str. 80-412]|uniref:Novel STAND NTPase 3 domain-containing protein n=3 Tax=Leptospira alstonii TaxID=28452 RepID=M6CSA4_9LEPT|nr:hypothetical protein [Leptospira alstonii]EMJ93401.1 hypothetical protein LEP1GSC194_0304 [Leptospira alstonii serovar Sichuan str. 79601]EQA80391.1 hypothetical protein LEP1GSC193_0003 [Leptospira alstonii serovar Pingchang str. 80-412]